MATVFGLRNHTLGGSITKEQLAGIEADRAAGYHVCVDMVNGFRWLTGWVNGPKHQRWHNHADNRDAETIQEAIGL